MCVVIFFEVAGRWARGIVALVAGAAVLSCQTGAFVCSSDESCSGLEGGACEANGLCSVPNPDCVSGREYAELSGSAAGECVPAEDGTSTTVSHASTGGGSDPGPILTTSTEGGVSSSSGGGRDESGPSTGGEESGTTVMPPCGESPSVYRHDFADGMFARRDWTVNAFGQVDASFDGGTLTVSTEGDGIGSDVWWITNTFATPMAGSVALELVESPPPDSNASFWIELPSPQVTLSLAARGTQLRASIQTGDGAYVDQKLDRYDPVDHRWLRMRYDAATESVLAQTSPDVLTWSAFHDFDTSGFEFGNFNVDIGGGTFNGSKYTGVVASVAQIGICED